MNLKLFGHLPVVLAVLVLAPFQMIGAAETNNVLVQIERMASLGENAERGLGEIIADGIEKNPAMVSKEMSAKLGNPDLTEAQQAVYAWALGLAKDPAHVKLLKALNDKSHSELVKANCRRALAQIGGKESATSLLSILDATKDPDERFDLLNLLAQMQAEDALAKTEEILKKDPAEYYWQSIFVFGKMGDKAVPFLLKKIADPNRNIRANAIHVLGQWLIAPECAQPLQENYIAETNRELRVAILSSLEHVAPTLDGMKTFFEQAAKSGEKGEAETFARETLANMATMKKAEALYSQRKKPDGASFRTEYDKLFDSAGKEGDYALLAASSTLADESRLKTLRERILQRDSDECFHDFQKLNEIIMLNRRIGKPTASVKGRE